MPSEHSELILTLDPTKADWNSPRSTWDDGGVQRYEPGGIHYTGRQRNDLGDVKFPLHPPFGVKFVDAEDVEMQRVKPHEPLTLIPASAPALEPEPEPAPAPAAAGGVVISVAPASDVRNAPAPEMHRD